MILRNTKSGFTGLVVGGSCHEELEIKYCNSLVTIDKIPLTVAIVNIGYCGKLERVEWEEALTSSASVSNNRVSMITVTNCDSVVNVGNIPSTVEKLHIEDCKSLATVMCGGQWNMFNSSEATDGDGGDSSGGQLQLAHLVFLDISGCPKFMSLPDYVLLPSIQTMYMWDNDNQGALPKLMHTFTSLNFLSIRRCPKIHKFPEGGLPRTLTDLHIEDVNIKQPIREWGLGHLTHLRDLEIINIGWSGDSVECIMGKDITVGEDDDHDDSGCHFILYLPSTSLDYLKIAGFKILKSINCSTFSNLGALTIKHCPDLESMGPNNSLPSRLQLVEIENCPLIHKHCKPTPDGPIIIDDEWYTIS